VCGESCTKAKRPKMSQDDLYFPGIGTRELGARGQFNILVRHLLLLLSYAVGNCVSANTV
jgi:hypothetical protein